MDLDQDREKELISEGIELISKKWHSRILYHLLRENSANFSELKESIGGISNKVLSESLKDLDNKELIEKIDDNGSNYYKLTQKGKDLEDVFDSVLSWAENYLVEEKPKILVVEDNKQQAEMYKRWLKPAYNVETANTSSEFFDEIDEDTDAVLLDRRLPESSAGELLQSSDMLSAKQVIIITGIEPDMDLIQLDVDDYILKPVSKDSLRDSVSRVIKAARKTEDHRELIALISKKKVLDRKPHNFRENSEYQELVDRIKKLRQKTNGSLGLSDELLDKA